MKKTKKQLKLEKELFLIQKGQEYSKNLKLNATIWEKKFISILKNLGFKFEFQVPKIYKQNFLYIVDFIIPEYNIFIELDGQQHYRKESIKYDNKRTSHLQKMGLHPLRFSNKQVDTLTNKEINDIIIAKITSVFVKNSKNKN